jgi:uncharacterized protein (DUF433 family)
MQAAKIAGGDMDIPLALQNESPPLRTDTDGVVRIGRTRVTFESVIALFDQGAGTEEIALRFDALSLAEIYGVLAYYLKHPSEVRQYIEAQQAASARARDTFVDRAAASRLRARVVKLRGRDDAPAAG